MSNFKLKSPSRNRAICNGAGIVVSCPIAWLLESHSTNQLEPSARRRDFPFGIAAPFFLDV
jgi:hypothetical protein